MRALYHLIPAMQAPRQVIVDSASNFCAELLQKTRKMFHIFLHFISFVVDTRTKEELFKYFP